MAKLRHHALFIPSPSQKRTPPRDASVTEGLPILTALAFHYWERHSRLVELDELLEQGARVLQRVIGDYDPQRSTFRDYLEARLHWSLIAFVHSRASERRRQPTTPDEVSADRTTSLDFRNGLVQGRFFPPLSRAVAASKLEDSRPGVPVTASDLAAYDDLTRAATSHPNVPTTKSQEDRGESESESESESE